MQIVLIGGNSNTLTKEVTTEIQKAGWGILYVKNHGELKKALKQKDGILAIIIDNDVPVFSSPKQEFQQVELPFPKPLWILTAQKNHLAALAHAFQSGFDEFLAKPVRNELIALLKHKTVINKNTKK